RDRRAVLRTGSAGTAGRKLRLNDFVEEVFLHLGSEHFVRQVDGADLLALQIENIQGCHVLNLCSRQRGDLISTSTPADRSSFMRASRVCCVGSRMSRRRLWVRISNCSRDFLSTCGERSTVNLLILVGSGTGPAMLAPVRLAVSTISPADWASSRWSHAFSLIRH